jgi:hypothetical protein
MFNQFSSKTFQHSQECWNVKFLKFMNFILIYITNPTKREAKKIAKFLLEKKLLIGLTF